MPAPRLILAALILSALATALSRLGTHQRRAVASAERISAAATERDTGMAPHL